MGYGNSPDLPYTGMDIAGPLVIGVILMVVAVALFMYNSRVNG